MNKNEYIKSIKQKIINRVKFHSPIVYDDNIYVKENGTWKKAFIYLKNETWKISDTYLKNNDWKFIS